MTSILPIVGLGLVLCQSALAQSPPAVAPDASLRLTLEDAMTRARANSPQILQANINTLLAREDTRQAKAALLPWATSFNQFIYTPPNGDPSGVFVSADGTHVYNNQAVVHGDIYAPGKVADYRRMQVAEAVARARVEIAARGLTSIVVENYYGMVTAERKLTNARKSLGEAQRFLDITEKQERGGEAAHADVVKAQIEAERRQRESGEAQLGLDKARLGFSVLLFPDFRQDFTVVDDLDAARMLPPLDEIRALAGKNNPDIGAAQGSVEMQGWEVKAARSALLPSISFDYFFGINANQFALHNPEGFRNYGSAVQAQLTIPIWTWKTERSKITQAQLGLQQAKNDLSFTQRQLLANLNAFYREADTAGFQIASLRRSAELADQSLKLTLLRYQAGEAAALEVVDAQSTLADARNAYDDGLARYRLALANLQTLTGAF
ncbi:MAG: TolC family protein [Bryobacteraceae bacterium]|jgi:outer membrane protein TolC